MTPIRYIGGEENVKCRMNNEELCIFPSPLPSPKERELIGCYKSLTTKKTNN